MPEPAGKDAWVEVKPEGGHTRWSILGSGEGGTRIASLYFSKIEHPAVGKRILLLNTNRADLTNILDELRQRIQTDYGPDRVEEIEREHVVSFGEDRGAGNYFFQGEEYASRHFDSDIRRKLIALGIGTGDALVNIGTLGGGTGNGSIPYLIRKLRTAGGLGLGKVYSFSIAAWPFDNEDSHRHFNAVAGLSRLLIDEETGKQNADLLILCDNTRLEKLAGSNGRKRDPHYFGINTRIVEALDMLTSGGRHAVNVIDVEDLIRFPSKVGLYHFTAGTSMGNDPRVVSLELALDMALEDTFFPIDSKQVLIAYLVVRVPENLQGRGEFTTAGIREAFTRWRNKNLNTRIGMVSLTAREQDDPRFDVCLLLGGFGLRKFLERPLKHYDEVVQLLGLQEDNKVQLDRLAKIRTNLQTYLERITKAHAIVGGKT